MLKTISLLLILCAGALTLPAQEITEETVRMRLTSMKDDTAKVNRMNEYAAEIMSREPIIALNTMHAAGSLAQKLNYPLGQSVAYGLESRMLFYQVKFDSGKLLLDKAYRLIEKNNDKQSVIQKAILTHTYANIFHQKQEYDSALTRYLEAIALFTKVKEENKIFFSFYNISGIYNLMNDTAKAMYYAKETKRMAEAGTDSNYIMRSQIAMTEAYAGRKEYDSVFAVSQRGLAVALKLNNVFGVGKFYTMLGTYYVQKTKQYDTAISYFKEALDLYNSINIWYDIALVKQLLGNAYLQKADYSSAVKYLKEADEIAVQMKLDQVRLLTLNDLVLAEEKRGNLSAGYAYLKAVTTVKDSLQARNNRKAVNELEAKYQTQKKELQLLSLEKNVRQKQFLLYLFGGAAVSLLVITLLSYRTYKQKQKLQQQQITQLEKEKQLMAAEAVLQGQEEERTRLAKDLHDGLGGMLSGIKYALNTMKGNQVFTPENAHAFNRSIDMLDGSIKELRSVAHNLMPENLVKFGLTIALRDFCSDITASGALKVNFHSFGTETLRLSQNAEVILYRVVQELINNAIKHAAASEAIVQLQHEDHSLQITVEDDGKGFDVNALEVTKGIGWSNIKNRLDYLKGRIHIFSEKEKGTTVTIDLSV